MKKYQLLLCVVLASVHLKAQDSIVVTYTLGHIPTSLDSFDASCTGPSSILVATLPAGDNYEITGIKIEYDMTALGSGWMSRQRSMIYCDNTGMSEDTISGAGDMTGTFPYSRTGVNIANGSYPGATNIIFQMRAWRVNEAPSECSTLFNRIDNSTWTITLYFGNELINPKVGVATNSPGQALDVSGKIKVSDDTNIPEAGTIRWNSADADLEVYDGSKWLSLTGQDIRWGTDQPITENWTYEGTTSEKLGSSASISAAWAVGGSPEWSSLRGRVHFFKRIQDGWLRTDGRTGSDGASNDEFGSNVSVSGDYAIVGAPFHNTNGDTDRGKAYIFHRNNDLWPEQAILIDLSGLANDNFGNSVSISGDYAIVGSPGHDNPLIYQDRGNAYIFKRSGVSWDEQALLAASDGAAFDWFGHGVSISGDYAVVGSPIHDTNGANNRGKAYIFKRSGNAWTEQAILVASDGVALDLFGQHVSISGDYAIVSATGHDTNGDSDRGKAYIFKRTGNTWMQQAILISSDGAASDFFSRSVSISGEYAVVGAPGHDTNGNGAQGKAYLFKRTGTTWTEEEILVASTGISPDNFGAGVGVSTETNGQEAIVIGAPWALNAFGKIFFFNK